MFPLKEAEAKELFRQGTKPNGTLSRQAAESMMSYASRRRRRYRLLQNLDPEMVLSMGHRADLLLDMAGLDYNQKLMVQSSVQNVRDF